MVYNLRLHTSLCFMYSCWRPRVKYNTYLKRSLQLPRSPRDLQLKQRLTTAFDETARATSNSVVATAVCHLLPLLLLPPPLLMVRWRRGGERVVASTCFPFSLSIQRACMHKNFGFGGDCGSDRCNCRVPPLFIGDQPRAKSKSVQVRSVGGSVDP